MNDFKNKLKQYGTLTAGVLIAGTKVAKTQILYTDVNPDVVVGHNGQISLDLDNDATMDLTIRQYFYTWYYFYTYSRVYASNHPNADLVQYTSSSRADRMDESEVIGASKTFSTSSSITLGYNSSSSYDWSSGAPHTNKYLGVRLVKGSNYLYGWIRLDYSSNSNGFTVKDMAVEMSNNIDILAGNGMNIDDATLNVPEDATNGTSLGILTASGPSMSFSIVSGNPGGEFTLNATTGELTVSNALDFETTSTYTLMVEVTDGKFTDQATITINVTDVDEAPAIASQTFTIDENSADGTVVGTVAATDPENNISGFSIKSGNTGGAFSISASGELKVSTSSALDFETNPTFTLVVEVTDGTNNTDGTVTVNLNNVKEPDGIEEVNELSFNLYPNPVEAGGNITVELPFAGEATISLLNVEGQQIRLIRGVRNKAVFSADGISKGTYFIKVQDAEGKVGVRKIVIE